MLSLLSPTLLGRTFTDDAGVVHSWTDAAKPTLIAAAYDALTLMHMGVDSVQVKGTYGERATSGSNVNGYYHDGNAEDHGAHGSAAYSPHLFPVDPSPAEVAALQGAIDLSPSCSGKNYWCGGEVDWSKLDAAGWPDFVLEGSYGTAYPLDASPGFRSNATANGAATIVIKRVDANGVTRGLVEMIEVHERLATFLGVTGIADLLAIEKQHLCSAVESFKHITKAAQEAGIRAMAAYAPWGSLGADIGGWIYSPNGDMVAAMLEELGMPILHVNGGTEAMVSADYSAGKMSATDLKSKDPDNPVSYPVDFWLYDVRVALDFTSASFAQAWPHPAVVAAQYAYWPSGGHVVSYQHAADILTLVGAALANSNRLFPKTECTAVSGIAGDAHRTDGLAPGQYACYAPVEYAWCAAHTDMHGFRKAEPSPPPPPAPPACGDEGFSDGTVAGIAVGCAFGGATLGAIAVMLIKGMGGATKPPA